MKKYMASLHSSYNLFHFKEGNCEGHVNLMSIMLNLVGIDSFIVHCKDKRFKNYNGDTNHAMIRVKLKLSNHIRLQILLRFRNHSNMTRLRV